jgi:hypothetical protein
MMRPEQRIPVTVNVTHMPSGAVGVIAHAGRYVNA